MRLSNMLRMIITQNTEDYSEYEFLLDVRNETNMANLAKNFNYKNHKFLHHSFIKLTVQSNAKKAELNIEKSNAAYDRVSAHIATHIILKRRIMKVYNYRSFAKIKSKVATDFFTNNYLIHTFRGLANQKFVVYNIYNLLKKNSGLLEIFFSMNDILKGVVSYFYLQKITNPIDFHYLMSLVRQLGEVGASYSEFIKDWTIKQSFNQQNQEVFIKKKSELNSLVSEFNLWKQSKELKENLDEKIKKKKRLLGVKWEERAVLGKMTKGLKATKGKNNIKKKGVKKRDK